MKPNHLQDLSQEIRDEYKDLLRKHGSLSRKLTNSRSKDDRTKSAHCTKCDGLKILGHCPVYDHPYDCEWGDYVSDKTIAVKSDLGTNESQIYSFCTWHHLRYPFAILVASLLWFIFS